MKKGRRAIESLVRDKERNSTTHNGLFDVHVVLDFLDVVSAAGG